MSQTEVGSPPTPPPGSAEPPPPRLAPAGDGRGRFAGRLVNLVMILLVGYLVLVPLVILIYSSFKSSTTRLPFQVPGFSLDNFRQVFESSHFASVTLNTVLYVVGSLVIALVLSTGLAYLMERTDIPGRRFLSPMALSPMAVPVTVMAIAWALVANPVNGPLAVLLRETVGLQVDIYSLPGMILVMGIFGVPSMYLMIAPAFARLNPELEEAAATMGAPLRRRLRLIVLPLVMPAVSAAAMLFVVVALEGFAIPAILGLPKQIFVFSSQIQYYVEPPTGLPDYGQASTYGVLLLAVSLVMLMVYRRRTKDANRFRVVVGKAYRPSRAELGRWRIPIFVVVCLYLFVGIGLPILTLLWTSLSPFVRPITASGFGSMTLSNYAHIFTAPDIGQTVLNTALIVLFTATASTALSTWIAIAAARKQFPGSKFLFEATSLVFGIPSVVLGFAILFLYVFVPVPPIYDTVWIIVVALVARYLPRGSRMMQTALLQLDDGLVEAARVTGARPATVTRTVLLPLLRPALRKTWLWVFAQSLGELPIALVLTSSDNRTLVVQLWDTFTSSGDYPGASALAVVILAISSVAVWLVNRDGTMEES
ncbi:ABC transporter permease [Amycolatopsis jiangsuensis]|uniref:Iron(III) transport system permease protein n=1 Tax=Amycolatopsis jiangsuensis TaxID=1181879 RepID=A0A840J2J3_9PSEU|nr:iron ABC transporter permease [Amycolatopsis jiangsuensis]MBB4689281.1 iron(III) transport system permease protein [Amycolatopsis jiangsuensis]